MSKLRLRDKSSGVVHKSGQVSDFSGISSNEPTDPDFGYPDLEAIRANMILAGRHRHHAGAGAYIHDIPSWGFDKLPEATGAPTFTPATFQWTALSALFLRTTARAYHQRPL